jgi:hypothetical protein
VAYPNGTIGCPDPAHRVNEPPPPGLSGEDRITWIVDHAPPLSAEQIAQIRAILFPGGR